MWEELLGAAQHVRFEGVEAYFYDLAMQQVSSSMLTPSFACCTNVRKPARRLTVLMHWKDSACHCAACLKEEMASDGSTDSCGGSLARHWRRQAACDLQLQIFDVTTLLGRST